MPSPVGRWLQVKACGLVQKSSSPAKVLLFSAVDQAATRRSQPEAEILLLKEWNFTQEHLIFTCFRVVRFNTNFHCTNTQKIEKMGRSTATKDAQALFRTLHSAYAATPTNLKIIDLYIVFAVVTAVIQVVYMAIVGSFPFNSFLSGLLSCVGTAVLAVCLRIQVNKENKEFKDLPPERAFADFVLCNVVLHLVIMNFLG
ncbi:Dolichyl-diphosphooligosaccharide--protein glycosyltransferase subunit DAD1 [Forsythia ovata]|uniref:Dolichyl-diphosphooligosaccharide--protein glycosyltransferase subunit DAD1 n=1 Tax=Forsythia ovata TaxID=205694 RepID=A0ABD1R509_9LAMI